MGHVFKSGGSDSLNRNVLVSKKHLSKLGRFLMGKKDPGFLPACLIAFITVWRLSLTENFGARPLYVLFLLHLTASAPVLPFQFQGLPLKKAECSGNK